MSLEYRLLVFMALSLGVMFADSRFDYLDRVRYTVAYVSTPVYWVADIPARASSWIDDVFVSQRDLIEENAQLRQELLFAQRELQLLAGLASENSRLRELQEASQAVQGRVITAEIINVSNDPGSRRVLINRGAHNGVFEGQAILDAHGLMGQVVEVLPFTSWVLLITDSRHGTPVQVNRNGERAIARGGRGDVPGLELEYVPDTADIVVGDLLVSSGLGQRYPKDYPVAEVTRVFHDPGQPFALIRARPLAQMDRTRHVMLVVPDDEVIGGGSLELLPELPDTGVVNDADGEAQAAESQNTEPQATDLQATDSQAADSQPAEAVAPADAAAVDAAESEAAATPTTTQGDV